MLISEYGRDRQFDLIFTLDQHTFLNKQKKALASGISIDARGNIIGNLNLVSYLKLAPKGVGPKSSTKKSYAAKRKRYDEDEEEEDDDDDGGLPTVYAGQKK